MKRGLLMNEQSFTLPCLHWLPNQPGLASPTFLYNKRWTQEKKGGILAMKYWFLWTALKFSVFPPTVFLWWAAAEGHVLIVAWRFVCCHKSSTHYQDEHTSLGCLSVSNFSHIKCCTPLRPQDCKALTWYAGVEWKENKMLHYSLKILSCRLHKAEIKNCFYLTHIIVFMLCEQFYTR